MLNHPEMDEQAPVPTSGKLVLPALPDTPDTSGATGAQYRLRTPQSYTDKLKAQVGPAQLIRPTRSNAPRGLFARLAYYWRKDPAHKVFMLAVVMVVLASIVFVSMVGTAWLGKPFSNSPYAQNPPTVTAPTGTVDLRPIFASPGGGKGSTQSSQPPAYSTPVVGTTPSGSPTPSPTQPGQGGTLTAQITGYPPVVANGSHAFITVSTSEPGVTVFLYIQSNSSPRFNKLGPGTTDASGSVTFDWLVSYFGNGRRLVSATLTAVAFDQNGQRADSAPVSVQVLLQGLP